MKKLTIIIAMLISLTFTACSKLGTFDENKASEKSNDFPVNIYNTTVTQKVEKVVSISPAITEIIFEIGYGEKIIGKSTYCDYPTEVSNIETVGSPAKFDIDKIIELKPDIVITQSPMANIDKENLQDNDIQVLSIPAPKSFYELYDIYGAISKIFIGNNLDAFVEEYVLKIDNALSEIVEKEYFKSFLYITSQNGAVATGDTFTGDILSVFGENIASTYSDFQMPFEEISKAEPDIIFIAKGIDTENLPEEFQELFEDKTQIIEIDNAYFEKPTGRITELLKQITDEISVE